LKYGKQALALASTNEDTIDALSDLARTYMRNKLYNDARDYLRQALKIDEDNPDVIADMAQCYFIGDNLREAYHVARLGLMIDPDNESCKRTLKHCMNGDEELRFDAMSRMQPNLPFVLLNEQGVLVTLKEYRFTDHEGTASTDLNGVERVKLGKIEPLLFGKPSYVALLEGWGVSDLLQFKHPDRAFVARVVEAIRKVLDVRDRIENL
jgi:tetratricopeptide (TPR) repeat protein